MEEARRSRHASSDLRTSDVRRELETWRCPSQVRALADCGRSCSAAALDRRRKLDEWRRQRCEPLPSPPVCGKVTPVSAAGCGGRDVAAKPKNNENRLPSSLALAPAIAVCCGKADDESLPPVTPARRRAHVDAVSPLADICQNAGRSAADTRQCSRPRQVLATEARPEEASHHLPAMAGGEAPHSALPRAGAVDCGFHFAPPGRDEARAGASALLIPDGMNAARALEQIVAYEEWVEVPRAPPPSPATPRVEWARREPGAPWLAPVARAAEFRTALPAVLAAMVTATFPPDVDQAGPPDVLEDETHAAKHCEERPIADIFGSRQELVLEVEKDGMVQNCELEETDDADLEVGGWRRRLAGHQLVWPVQTALDMEDHLSRAYDIEAFWFLEVRDRANMAAADAAYSMGSATSAWQGQSAAERLGSIPEYPPGWPHWRMESFDLRQAARAGRA